MYSLIIADDHLLAREGIKSLIGSAFNHINIVAEVDNSKDLHKKVTEYHPSIVIIDYHSSESNPNGFKPEDIERIYSHSPQTNILVITKQHQKADILKVLSYGVINFILKICDKEEFNNAINATLRKEKFFCGKVLDAILQKHFPKNDTSHPGLLTAREVEIVQLISEGLTNNEMALYLNLSVHTVNTHRKNILKKLQLKNSSELIIYAIRNKIIDTPQENVS